MPTRSCLWVLATLIAPAYAGAAIVATGDAIVDEQLRQVRVAAETGDGELLITAPTYLITRDLHVGTLPDATGRLTLDGGTVDVDGGDLRVGSGSTGTVDIRNGGRLVVMHSRDMGIGLSTNGIGSISVRGVGSQLFAAGTDFRLGGGGIGTLLFEDGAYAVFRQGSIRGIGSSLGFGTSSLLASGHGTMVEFTQELRLSAAIVAVEDGARLVSQAASNAGGRATTGHIRVAGIGSRWDVSSSFDLGGGSLQIVDGGTVVSQSFFANQASAITVHGAGSELRTERLEVFGNTVSQFDVAGGALLAADQIELNGTTMDVRGVGSRLLMNRQQSNIIVGSNAPARMRIDAGASAFGGTISLGNGVQQSDLEIADGAQWLVNSLEINAASVVTIDEGVLGINGLGDGQLIRNRGIIRGSGTIMGNVWNDRGSLIVRHGQQMLANSVNNLNFSLIEVNGGALTVSSRLQNSDSSTISVSDGTITQDLIGRSDFAEPISNDGTMFFLFGVNSFHADLINRGNVVVYGGSQTTFRGVIRDEGNIHVAASSTAVFQGELSTLGLHGSGTVRIEGDFLPSGEHPASVAEPFVVGGDLELSPTSTTHFDIAGFNSDFIDAAGDVTLGGTLDLDLWFLPENETLVEIISANSVLGAFDQIPDLGTDLGNGILFGGIDYHPNSVVVTLLGPTGDFNGDGNVDAIDLGTWQSGYGTLEGAELSGGDAQRDGDIDGADFLTWQRGVSAAEPPVASQSVPEPSSVWMILLAATALLAQRP